MVEEEEVKEGGQKVGARDVMHNMRTAVNTAVRHTRPLL